MNGWVNIIFAIPLAWIGSMEWRMRGKVGHKTFDQNREDINQRLGRGVERFDHIDDALKEQNDILIELKTNVQLLVKGKSIK